MIKKTDFLKKLRTAQFLEFCASLSELCQSAGQDADGVRIMRLVNEADAAMGVSRASQKVEEQQELVKMIKAEVSVLRSALRYYRDENEKRAYSIYCNTIKLHVNNGYREYVRNVSFFLEGLGDMEFDGVVASEISTLRILLSRYSTNEIEKELDKHEIKSRRTATDIRRELQQIVILMGAKFMIADEEEPSGLCAKFNSLLSSYKSAYLKHFADKDDEGEDNTDSNDEQRADEGV